MVDYKGTTKRNWSTTFKQKYRLTERRHIFLKPKDDRTYGERVDDRLEAGYRGAQRWKDAVKMVEATYKLGGDITKESEEMQIEALERGLTRAKGNVWRSEYHFRSDPSQTRQRPICIVILCR